MDRPGNSCRIFASVLLAVLALGACGKVGDPVAPSADGWPHQYPKAEILPETGTPPPAPKPATTTRPTENPFTSTGNPYSSSEPGDNPSQ
jgi:hypothetical protein